MQRDPSDVLARYDLASGYVANGGGATPAKADAALAQLDAALAVQPLASFLSMKAQILGGWKGDLIAMRATLEQLERLPIFERTEDQPLFTAMWGALLERQPERVLAAAALTTRPYLAHAAVPGPRAWSQAHAHRRAGRDDLARLDWLAAESALRERLRESPNAVREQFELAVTLAWLGQPEETTRVASQASGVALNRLMAYCHAGLGDGARAVAYIRGAINKGVWLTDQTLPLDPWWDKLRGQPEFEALLAEAKGRARQTEDGGRKTAPAAEEALRIHEQLAGIKLTPGSRMTIELALIYLRLGRWDEVLAHPPSAHARLRLDPRFDPIRQDPRFEKLLAAAPPENAK